MAYNGPDSDGSEETHALEYSVRYMAMQCMRFVFNVKQVHNGPLRIAKWHSSRLAVLRAEVPGIANLVLCLVLAAGLLLLANATH